MVTTLVAIRHAKTVSSEGYAEDALRPLSEQGKNEQQRLANRLKEAGFQPHQILTSPLLRAVQSAEILSETFHIPLLEEEALGELFNAKRLLTLIPPPEQNQTIFLVGHAPTLAQFVNDLTQTPSLPQGLPKSGAAVVTFAERVDFGKGIPKHIEKLDLWL